MPSDLVVTRILLPPKVSAPCKTRVDVDITNIGTDVAQLPFDVVLELLSVDEHIPPRLFKEWVRGLEGERLRPNQTVTVTFQVSFPCRTQTQLRVTADFSGLVLNNARTDPQKTIVVAPIDLVPWLQSSLQIVMYTPIGNIFV